MLINSVLNPLLLYLINALPLHCHSYFCTISSHFRSKHHHEVEKIFRRRRLDFNLDRATWPKKMKYSSVTGEVMHFPDSSLSPRHIFEGEKGFNSVDKK